MKGFRKFPSQCLRLTKHQTKNLAGSHVMTTEAQTLEQALHIIEVGQIQKKTDGLDEGTGQASLAGTRVRAGEIHRQGEGYFPRQRRHPQGPSHARSRAQLQKREAKHVPHPYRDLPEEAKPIKAREMLASGNWGLGSAAGRRLAVLFGVDRPTMAQWLGIEVMSTREYDAKFARKKP